MKCRDRDRDCDRDARGVCSFCGRALCLQHHPENDHGYIGNDNRVYCPFHGPENHVRILALIAQAIRRATISEEQIKNAYREMFQS